MFDLVFIDGKLTFVEKGSMSLEEVERIKSLFEFTSSYSVVKMMENVVIRNHQDYLHHMQPENLAKYADALDDAVVIANQFALNYATSIQSFIDISERQLQKTKTTEKELEFYRQFQHQMYDSNLEYRFWMRLRNFVVHCGFPYTEVTQNSNGIQVLCPKSHLLSSRKWNAVQKDIENMPNDVRIEAMVCKMTHCISALRLVFVGLYAEEITSALREYAAFCRQYNVKNPEFIEVESEENIRNGLSYNPLPVTFLHDALEDLKKVPFVNLKIIDELT